MVVCIRLWVWGLYSIGFLWGDSIHMSVFAFSRTTTTRHLWSRSTTRLARRPQGSTKILSLSHLSPGAYFDKIRRINPRYPSLALFSSSSSSSSSFLSNSTSSTSEVRPEANPTQSTTLDEQLQQRQDLLHERLLKLGHDPVALQQAALQSIQDPLQGYDARFGKSAIKAYRSFVRPKKTSISSNSTDNNDNKKPAMAWNVAQQVDFLIKRHEAHETEWIRHTDTLEKDTTTTKRFPVILILDQLRSALNVGSLFRTAEAAGCTAVWTVGITPHPGGNGAEKLAKSALGAERLVPHQHFATLSDAINYLKTQNSENETNNSNTLSTTYQVVGMETTSKSQDYTRIRYNSQRGVALVLGNEVTGISAASLDTMDAIVEIPTFGVKNSLNVAACAPIVVYEILRQWKASETNEEDTR